MISACPLWPGSTAGIYTLQCGAHASVGMSCARSYALSYPAFGKALRAFLRAQKGWQNGRGASEAREWRLHPQMLITSTGTAFGTCLSWIKGTQLCRDVVDSGNCKLPVVSNTWTGLFPCGIGLVSERRDPRRWAGVCRGALELEWSQWLCVTGGGRGGDPVWHWAVATLPCPGAVGAAPGSPVQVPIPQDAQMLLVTAGGFQKRNAAGGCVKGVGAPSPTMGGFSCDFLLVQMIHTGDLLTWPPLRFSELSGTAQCSQTRLPVTLCFQGYLDILPLAEKLGICNSILKTNLQF